MIISGNVKVEIDLSDQELGRAVLGRALQFAGVDDPGVDYFTDDSDNVYMGEYSLGYNPKLAAMIDAANYLIYGHRMGAGRTHQAKAKHEPTHTD